MNDDTTQNFITNYQDALDNTPQEVRDFLWSDAYKGIIAGIVKTCALTPEQGEVVSDVLFDLTINTTDEFSARSKLTNAGITKENQDKIFVIGYEYIINPSVIEAENVSETTTATQEDLVLKNAPSPSDVLANLGARLSQPSVIAPSKRDYSSTNTGDSAITPAPQKIFDPYRELPEK